MAGISRDGLRFRRENKKEKNKWNTWNGGGKREIWTGTRGRRPAVREGRNGCAVRGHSTSVLVHVERDKFVCGKFEVAFAPANYMQVWSEGSGFEVVGQI